MASGGDNSNMSSDTDKPKRKKLQDPNKLMKYHPPKLHRLRRASADVSSAAPSARTEIALKKRMTLESIRRTVGKGYWTNDSAVQAKERLAVKLVGQFSMSSIPGRQEPQYSNDASQLRPLIDLQRLQSEFRSSDYLRDLNPQQWDVIGAYSGKIRCLRGVQQWILDNRDKFDR